MKDNEKLLFKMNVAIDVVTCESCVIQQSSVLKLADIETADSIKIIRLLDLFDLCKIDYDNILLRVDHIVSYDIENCYLKCYVQVCYIDEVL